jgi:hypothetical protein
MTGEETSIHRFSFLLLVTVVALTPFFLSLLFQHFLFFLWDTLPLSSNTFIFVRPKFLAENCASERLTVHLERSFNVSDNG